MNTMLMSILDKNQSSLGFYINDLFCFYREKSTGFQVGPHGIIRSSKIFFIPALPLDSCSAYQIHIISLPAPIN